MKTLFKRLGVQPLVIELDELGMFTFLLFTYIGHSSLAFDSIDLIMIILNLSFSVMALDRVSERMLVSIH